jgi:molybdopterin synthase catalytic subunit
VVTVVHSSADDWIELRSETLPLDEVLAWSVVPGCGAQVLFSGTVRDHAEGRPGVTQLEYEAYAEMAQNRLVEIAAEARRRWPGLGRVALLHRVGLLGVGECSVVVVVAAPHRDAAFESARWCIDTLKATVPIWKRETWEGGVSWGTDAADISSLSDDDNAEGRVPS